MKSFFNKYSSTGSIAFQKVLSISGSKEIMVFGQHQNGVSISRFDANSNIIWSKKIITNQVFSINNVKRLANGNFIILGYRSTYTLLCVNPNGKVLWNFNYQSDDSVYLLYPHNVVELGNKEIAIIGTHIYRENGNIPQRIEYINLSQEGKLNFTYTIGTTSSLEVTSAIAIDNEVIFAGSIDQGGGRKGFLYKMKPNLDKNQANSISYGDPSKSLIVEALCNIGNNQFALAGTNQGEILVSIASFDNIDLKINNSFRFNGGGRCRISKIINANNHIYIHYEDYQQYSASIAKVFINPVKNVDNKLVWVKSFDLENIALNDIIEKDNQLYLTGIYAQNQKVNQQVATVLIKTDLELEGCLTKTISGKKVLPSPQVKIQKIKGEIRDYVVKATKGTNQIQAISLKKEELCPPPVIDQKNCPTTIVGWNNLRPRAKSRKLDRAVKAEIRDAAWMLSRQWQWGEFNGSDGGSIVFSKLSLKNTQVNRYTHLTNNPKNRTYNNHIPLEYKAEKLRYNIESDHLLRIQIGQYWIKLLEENFTSASILTNIKTAYHKEYNYTLPSIPSKPDKSDYTDDDTNDESFYLALNNYIKIKQLESDHISWATLVAANRRAIDGYELFKDLINNLQALPSAVAQLAQTHKTKLTKLNKAFVVWLSENYGAEDFENKNNAWSDHHLEYQFGVSAPDTEKKSKKLKLKGDEYRGGRLDWYSLDYDTSTTSITDAPNDKFTPYKESVNEETRVLIPAKIDFSGMPTARWWEMEDYEVNFGDMYVNKTDVSKLLLLDFIVNYADNWYILPYQSEIGNLIHLEGIEVKDNFGIRTLINSANSIDRPVINAATDDFKYWNLFTLANQEVDKNRLFLAPTCKEIQESKPFEQINFIRDEIANMVWGIEKIVPNALGDGIDGFEASTHLQGMLKETKEILPNEVDEESKPKLKYQFMTSVPENWIPFIPAHIKNSIRSIQLQRAALPRDIEGFNNPVKPRTNQLTKIPSPYTIHEEEVPKVGCVLKTTWQRTRWINGKTFLWIGNQKQVGKQVGGSGLKFDQVYWEDE